MAEEEQDVFRETRGLITFEWELKKFFDLPYQHGEWLLSPTFWLYGALYRLEIYPNGDRKEDSVGWISLYIEKIGLTAEEENVSILSGVKKTDGSYLLYVDLEYTFHAEEDCWEHPKFIQKSELYQTENVVGLEGDVTFFCTIRVLDGGIKDNASQTVTPDGVVNLIRNFKDLFLSRRFSDVKIKIGDLDFEAHKSVLAARSSVFATRFEEKTAENKGGVVEITDCESDSFEDFLLFLYTGELSQVSLSNALSLYKTAHKYEIVDLKEECSQRIVSGFSVDTICDVVQLAEIHNDSQLLKEVTEFFISNAENILASEKWKTFYADSTSLATELLIKLAQNKSS